MRFNLSTVAIVATVSTAAIVVVDAHSSGSSIFGVARHNTQSFGQQPPSLSLLSKNNNNNNILNTLSTRGGAGADLDSTLVGEEDTPAAEETLYLPGLLEAIVPSKSSANSGNNIIQPTASLDYTLTISSSKAKELKVKEGDVVAVIGRRRRASYGKVHIVAKGLKSGNVKIGTNLATNLRIRDTDTVKIVSLHSSSDDDSESYTLGAPPTQLASSITLSPIVDSLHTLSLRERDGDEFSDTELTERFVLPYLNSEEDGECIMKEGHTLTLKDDNGVALDFMVGYLDMSEGSDDEEEEAEKGKYIYEFLFVGSFLP